MWFPDAIHDPGLNANYRRGRSTGQMDVAHFTVGIDSRALIRDRGLAPFLFPKQGPPIQFAPDDAVCAHACEWNILGAGFEVERMSWDEPFTSDQTYWVGRVVRWRAENRGIPLEHWFGDRLPIGSPFRGTANHGSLVHRACDQHTDGWTHNEWEAAVGGKEDQMDYVAQATGGQHWHISGVERVAVTPDQAYALVAALGLENRGAINDVLLTSYAVATPTSGGGTPPPPVDLDGLAKKVADLLAARLKD